MQVIRQKTFIFFGRGKLLMNWSRRETWNKLVVLKVLTNFVE